MTCFRCSWFQRLSSSVSVRGARIHQCAYSHQLPGALPYHFCKKDTAFYSNLPGISRLEKLCPGVGPDHIHERAWGSRRVGEKTISLAAAAGTYPVQLCEVLAQVVFEQLDSYRLQLRHGRRTSKDYCIGKSRVSSAYRLRLQQGFELLHAYLYDRDAGMLKALKEDRADFTLLDQYVSDWVNLCFDDRIPFWLAKHGVLALQTEFRHVHF